MITKLTVVMPVYNVKNYLSDAINSIIKQTGFDKTEVILIDDGSTDGSAEICDNYAAEYENIYCKHIPNGGVSNARNTGLSIARGEYIHFMDSDDILSDKMYEEFFKIVDEYNPDLIVGGVERYNLTKNSGAGVKALPAKTRFYVDSEIKNFLNGIKTEDERWLFDYIWNKWFKREVIVGNQLIFDKDISLGEDFDFNCRYFTKINSVYTTKSTIYRYFIRGGGLVTAFHKEPWVTREKLYNRHIEVYRSRGCLSEERLKDIKSFQGFLCFAALRSINKKRCFLTKKEKKEHLKMMTSGTVYELTAYYLSENKNIKNKILYMLLKGGKIYKLKILLLLDKLFINR